jgi:hypothetical protein
MLFIRCRCARTHARVWVRTRQGERDRQQAIIVPPEPAQFDIFGEFFVRFVIFVLKIRRAILKILITMIIILRR